jgi:hypothetical protein
MERTVMMLVGVASLVAIFGGSIYITKNIPPYFRIPFTNTVLMAR